MTEKETPGGTVHTLPQALGELGTAELALAELSAARADEARWQAEARAGSARAREQLRRIERRLSRAEDALWALADDLHEPSADPAKPDRTAAPPASAEQPLSEQNQGRTAAPARPGEEGPAMPTNRFERRAAKQARDAARRPAGAPTDPAEYKTYVFVQKDKQALERKVEKRLAQLEECADDRSDRRLAKLIEDVNHYDGQGCPVPPGQPADPAGRSYFDIDLPSGLLHAVTHKMMLVQERSGVWVSAFSSIGHRVHRAIPDDSPIHRALVRAGGIDRRSPEQKKPPAEAVEPAPTAPAAGPSRSYETKPERSKGAEQLETPFIPVSRHYDAPSAMQDQRGHDGLG